MIVSTPLVVHCVVVIVYDSQGGGLFMHGLCALQYIYNSNRLNRVNTYLVLTHPCHRKEKHKQKIQSNKNIYLIHNIG